VAGRLIPLVLSALVAVGGVARADAPEIGAEETLNQKIAVWRFDALGIDTELVAKLETLFRSELDRLDKQPLPTRRDMEKLVTGAAAECTGEDKCLAAIGKKLGVDIVVTGTVGSLGQYYVLNIKAVETASGKQLQRIQSDPLKGSPDDLIEGVRVAAYRLLAPAQLHGAIQIATDLVGAQVSLDGGSLGKTPLPNNGVIQKQTLGKHKLRVEAAGYSPFEDDVDVHFQKVSQVVVRLVPSKEIVGTGKVERVERHPFYSKTWFIVAAGAAAIALGAFVGYEIGHTVCFNPDGSNASCK
jgi:hypothetical protein